MVAFSICLPPFKLQQPQPQLSISKNQTKSLYQSNNPTHNQTTNPRQHLSRCLPQKANQIIIKPKLNDVKQKPKGQT